MRTRRVGASDIEVSALGLGTMTWGHGTTITDAIAILRRFLDAGGTLIDTAAAYGFGDVESLIGHLCAKTFSRRALVLATKSGYVVRDGDRVVDTSATTLLDDLTGSLRRLRTDHVDLWQIHARGDAPIEETLTAADTAVAKGMARQVGVSNFLGWQIAEAATWQKALGHVPVVSAQAEYSLLARRAEVEILPCVRQLGLGFFPWSPLGRGVLTGKYRTATPPDSRGGSKNLSWFVEPYLQDASTLIVDAVAKAARGLALSAAQVALLWVRDAPGVTAPLIGPRTPDQLEPLLALDDNELPEVITAALDDASGGACALRAPENKS